MLYYNIVSVAVFSRPTETRGRFGSAEREEGGKGEKESERARKAPI